MFDIYYSFQTVRLLVPERILWDSRDGYKPNWRPKCPGPDCVDDEQSSSGDKFRASR